MPQLMVANQNTSSPLKDLLRVKKLQGNQLDQKDFSMPIFLDIQDRSRRFFSLI